MDEDIEKRLLQIAKRHTETSAFIDAIINEEVFPKYLKEMKKADFLLTTAKMYQGREILEPNAMKAAMNMHRIEAGRLMWRFRQRDNDGKRSKRRTMLLNGKGNLSLDSAPLSSEYVKNYIQQCIAKLVEFVDVYCPAFKDLYFHKNEIGSEDGILNELKKLRAVWKNVDDEISQMIQFYTQESDLRKNEFVDDRQVPEKRVDN